MTFRQFAAFAEVAKQLNITKAAQALRMSQPSLSKHLKCLEEDYKIKLFTRYAKGIRLTNEGHEFIRDIEPILAQLEKFNQRYRLHSAELTNRRLNVGGTYGPASGILPSALAVFKKNHPKVDVTLRSNSNAVIRELLLKGELEVAICSRAPKSSLLCAETYVPLKLVAFAAKHDPVSKKKELTLSDLENIPLFIRSSSGGQSTTDLMMNEVRKQGYKVNIAMRCESPQAIMTAVSQRLGIGFLYYDAVKAAVERGSFKIIQIRGLNMEGQTYIVYNNERPLSPNAQEFLKLLRQWRDAKKMKKTVEEKKALVLASLVPLFYTAHRLSPFVANVLRFSRRLLVRI